MELIRRMFDTLWGPDEVTTEDVAEFYAHGFHAWAEESSGNWILPEVWRALIIRPRQLCFPDHEVTIEHMFASGDAVFVHYTFQGTFEGFGCTDYYTGSGVMLATHEEVSWSGVFIYRIEDGKIADEWWYWNKALTDSLGITEPSPW